MFAVASPRSSSSASFNAHSPKKLSTGTFCIANEEPTPHLEEPDAKRPSMRKAVSYAGLDLFSGIWLGANLLCGRRSQIEEHSSAYALPPRISPAQHRALRSLASPKARRHLTTQLSTSNEKSRTSVSTAEQQKKKENCVRPALNTPCVPVQRVTTARVRASKKSAEAWQKGYSSQHNHDIAWPIKPGILTEPRLSQMSCRHSARKLFSPAA